MEIAAPTVRRIADLAEAAYLASKRRSQSGEALGMGASAEDAALIGAVSALPDNQLAELVALMWLGSRSGLHFEVELAAARAQVREPGVILYVTGKSDLKKYLVEGLWRTDPANVLCDGCSEFYRRKKALRVYEPNLGRDINVCPECVQHRVRGSGEFKGQSRVYSEA